MQLSFEFYKEVCAGTNPSAIHTPDNILQVIYVDKNGNINAIDAPTPLGEWNDIVFGNSYIICDDKNVEYMKLKYINSSLFAVWKNKADKGEVVPYAKGIEHTMRHRFAVWAIRQNLSKYLIDGSIEFRLDDPVARVSISFENPGYSVSHEDDTILTPGTCLTLYFRSGSSEKYEMGKYYIDKNTMDVGETSTDVEGRNAIGKFLRDQTFDENNSYPSKNLQQTFQAILDNFEVQSYWVGGASFNVGMEFPQDMNGYDGILETLKTVRNWKIEESMDGTIGIGFITDSRFPQANTYEFERDTDIFSRNVSRDDQDAYSRVCVHNNDYSIAVYRDVNFRFVMGKKKTLHVSLAEGTILSDAEEYADELANLLGSVGIIESFVGPFRPHLQVGDNAQIIGPNTKLLGIITTVNHKFGKNGYYTEFVVDSGSTANKTRVSDYINKIAGKSTTGQTKRLY